MTLTQDLLSLYVTWNIDLSEPRIQGAKRSRQIGSLLRWEQAVSYFQTNGNVENCAQGAWEPRNLAIKESTQRETMIEPINCDKTVR